MISPIRMKKGIAMSEKEWMPLTSCTPTLMSGIFR